MSDDNSNNKLAAVILEGGEGVLAHMPDKCEGETCTIHNPSDHFMRSWPQHWRADRGIMERICEHGVGHPDPDDIKADTTHGCDGCCGKSPLTTYHDVGKKTDR